MKTRNRDFADGADRKRFKPLLAHLTEIRAEANSGERQQERPAGKIGNRADLFFVEEAVGGQNRNQQKSQHKLREFLPEEGRFVRNVLGLPLARPVNRIAEHHETDHGVTRGLHQHCQLSGSVRVERPGCGGFCGIVDRQTRPQSVGVIAQMQEMSDQRKREQRQRTQSQNCGNRETTNPLRPLR